MIAESAHLVTPDPVTLNQVHWRTNELLDAPPLLLVSEFEQNRIRELLAKHVDGRRANATLYRAAQAIRRETGPAPGAHIVLFPDLGLEIPIEVREISDEADRFAGFVYEPRGVDEVVFDLTELQGNLADHLASFGRSEAIVAMKEISADGQEFALTDACCDSGAFLHLFEDGLYWHSYHYVVATLSKAD